MELKTVQTQKIYKNIVEQIVDLIHDGSLKKGDKVYSVWMNKSVALFHIGEEKGLL